MEWYWTVGDRDDTLLATVRNFKSDNRPNRHPVLWTTVEASAENIKDALYAYWRIQYICRTEAPRILKVDELSVLP